MKKYKPGNRLYNSYAVGGYLTYALYPTYQIFMDSRYFPYTSWYKDYNDFNQGKTELKAFSLKYPFDVALVDYHYSKNTINELILAKDWQLVFYGTTAAVFVQKQTGFEFDYTASNLNRFAGIRSLFQAYTIFNFALNIGDWKTSTYLFNLMQEKFVYMRNYERIMYLSSLSLKGLKAMQRGDYDTAYPILDAYGLRPYMQATNKAILLLRNRRVKELVEHGELKAALEILEKTLSKLPEHFNSLYNAGVIGYILEKKQINDYTETKQWRYHLEKVINTAQGHQASQIARMLLEGEANPENIPLMLQ